MPALVAGIHALKAVPHKGVDGRDEPGHDDVDRSLPMAAGIREKALVIYEGLFEAQGALHSWWALPPAPLRLKRLPNVEPASPYCFL
jgi:hypothetical protein